MPAGTSTCMHFHVACDASHGSVQVLVARRFCTHGPPLRHPQWQGQSVAALMQAKVLLTAAACAALLCALGQQAAAESFGCLTQTDCTKVWWPPDAAQDPAHSWLGQPGGKALHGILHMPEPMRMTLMKLHARRTTQARCWARPWCHRQLQAPTVRLTSGGAAFQPCCASTIVTYQSPSYSYSTNLTLTYQSHACCCSFHRVALQNTQVAYTIKVANLGGIKSVELHQVRKAHCRRCIYR